MKIKQFGKNKVAFKKLVADENTKTTLENGADYKDIFKNLIGYEFLCEIVNGILKVTGIDGESFLIKTSLPIEIA